MKTYARILKIISIIAVTVAILSFLAAALVIAVGVYTIQNGGNWLDLLMNSVSTVDTQGINVTTQQIIVISVFSFTLCISGLFHLWIGLLGIRGANRPEKLRFFIILVGIIFAIDFISNIMQIANSIQSEEATIGFEFLKMTPTLLEFLMFFSAIRLRKMAKDEQGDSFQEPERLGFIRVIQILFIIEIVVVLSSTTFIVPKEFTFEPYSYIIFINLILDGISFWLIFKRFRFARTWIIGTCIFNVAASAAFMVVSGDFSLADKMSAGFFDIIILFYFLFAKRPKMILTRELTLEFEREEIKHAWEIWKPKTWDFWRSMIIYYCLTSIVGHWMEAGYCTLIRFGIMPGTYDPASGIWSDYLTPFPVYGFGMVACGLLLFPVKTWLQEKFAGQNMQLLKTYLCSFLFNMAIVAALELILGFTSNMPDENGIRPLWDYSDMPFNFMGQICLFNTMMFAACASLMSWIVWPTLQTVYVKLPNDIKKILFVGIMVFYALILTLYVVRI